MKNTILVKSVLMAGVLTALCACTQKGKITVTLPSEAVGGKLIVNYGPYDQEGLKADTLEIKSNQLILDIPQDGKFYMYVLNYNDNLITDLYLYPDQSAEVKVKKLKPFEYTISGTPLIDGIQKYVAAVTPVQNDFMDAREDGASTETLDSIYARYVEISKAMIAKDPSAPVAPYILAGLTGEAFVEEYGAVSPHLDKSPFAEYIELKRQEVEDIMGFKLRQQEKSEGRQTAPDFTLNDLDGRPVSLSSYRGKWVVLDFWGSWCGWCIKGFPELKENFAKYKDRLVIIGIDCGDTQSKWREAVKKHQLPWINVYNPSQGNSVEKQYGVEGFPTKVIINPNGEIVNLTTGEDPAFYKTLAKLMKE